LEALFTFVSVGSIDTTPSSFVLVLSIKLHFTRVGASKDGSEAITKPNAHSVGMRFVSAGRAMLTNHCFHEISIHRPAHFGVSTTSADCCTWNL
jgi:hypothetical protein